MRYRKEGEVREAQEARKANEAPPHDWDAKRKALVDSGVVAERARALCLHDIPEGVPCLACLGVGVL